jgi:transposase
MTKLKHPGGRPTLYRREMCDRLVKAMADGLTAEAAAAKIGISARSLFNWQKQRPEFLQAIQEGRQRSQLWWEERALAMAGGEPGNTQIVTLALKNRSRAASGWNNDAVKLEHTGPEGGPIGVNVAVPGTTKIDVGALSHEHRDQLRDILLAAVALAEKEQSE